MSAGELLLRPAEVADEAAVLDLLGASLGWVPDDQSARFFAWKHRENPFGTSPAWVATIDTEVVGFRTFLRWAFDLDGEPLRAVRAVDTATHPRHQGRGIFTRLTEHALDGLRADGVDLVFNTPNERSRPGYLKMGWQPVRRLPVRARPASLGALGRLVRARVPADKWSQPSGAGVPADEALADDGAVTGLLASIPGAGLRTQHTPATLRWRYGFAPLAYRAILAGPSVGDGLVVFRIRRRGPALEAAVCEELVPGGDARRTRDLLRRVLAESGADYAVRLGDHQPATGFVPLPGQGPTLVWRDVCRTSVPRPEDWHLGLGDVELF